MESKNGPLGNKDMRYDPLFISVDSIGVLQTMDFTTSYVSFQASYGGSLLLLLLLRRRPYAEPISSPSFMNQEVVKTDICITHLTSEMRNPHTTLYIQISPPP
jgi:hypothetical protein